MHATGQTFGWQFVLEDKGGRRRYTAAGLDRQYTLGLAGSSWEVGVLTRRVAALTGTTVEAWFNDRLMTTARPVAEGA